MTPVNRFRDRTDAGQSLARYLKEHYRRPNGIVLALPRGGVPVGREIARSLRVPLDVFVVRKVGFPQQPELAMGALATGGVQLLDDALISEAGVSESEVSNLVLKAAIELQQREALYRGAKPP